jgi:hypothetical protein
VIDRTVNTGVRSWNTKRGGGGVVDVDDCEGIVTGVFVAYGGGGDSGVTGGRRESVNELECEGLWLLKADRARVKIEPPSAGTETRCEDSGASTKSVI